MDSILSRILSAVILLPVVLFLLWMGGWWVFGLVALVATLAVWEYVHLLRQHRYPRASFVFATLLLWSILCSFQQLCPGLLQPAVAGVLVLSLAWHVFFDPTSLRVENWLLPLAGTLYIGWTSGHLLWLRALPDGLLRIAMVVGTVWLADTAAYLVGKTWGRHRMIARISPRKTWEGYAAGVIAGTAGGGLASGLIGWGWGQGTLLGLLLSMMATVGDLGVSMIKRQVGVKDSGRLIPGHGGAFDRLDSLLVGAVIGYYYYAVAALLAGG